MAEVRLRYPPKCENALAFTKATKWNSFLKAAPRRFVPRGGTIILSLDSGERWPKSSQQPWGRSFRRSVCYGDVSLADFMIGAHALLRAERLLTFNSADYLLDFPSLVLLDRPTQVRLTRLGCSRGTGRYLKCLWRRPLRGQPGRADRAISGRRGSRSARSLPGQFQ